MYIFDLLCCFSASGSFFHILQEGDKMVLLEKEDSSVIRGIAACFIMLAHLADMLTDSTIGNA